MTFVTKSWFMPLLITLIILGAGAIYALKLTNGEEIISNKEIRSSD